MIEFLHRRLLEREHLASLRIDSRHHVLDNAVLATGVHPLKNDQRGPAILRIEFVLQFGQALHSADQLRLRALFRFHAIGVAGIEILQAKFAAVLDAIGF